MKYAFIDSDKDVYKQAVEQVLVLTIRKSRWWLKHVWHISIKKTQQHSLSNNVYIKLVWTSWPDRV